MTKIRLSQIQGTTRLFWPIVFSLFFHGFFFSIMEKAFSPERDMGRPNARLIVMRLVEASSTSTVVNSLPQEKPPPKESRVLSPPTAPFVDNSTQNELVYIPSSLLDERPKLIKDIDYESSTLNSIKGAGKVRLSLWLGQTGKIDFVSTEESELSEEETKLLSRLFEGLEFSPGKLRGIRVPTVIEIEVNLPPAPAETK